MSNQAERALVPGSLGALARQQGVSLAESFLACETICLVDVSGSMGISDSRGDQTRYQVACQVYSLLADLAGPGGGDQTRYQVACQELAKLQESLPGKIGVVAFSDHPRFCPGGVPTWIGAGTDLKQALQFVQAADGTVRFILISDGYPDDQEGALRVARQFRSRIDVIYVGPEIPQSGRDFLQELARASGGRYVVAAQAQELANKVKQLILPAGRTSA